MKQKYEAITSAKAKCDDLLTQYNRIQEVEEKNSTEADSLRAQLLSAEAAYNTHERQLIRGMASADELAAAKTLKNNLREKLSEAERMSVLAREALSETEAEIQKAQTLVRTAFSEYCNGVKTDISKALDDDTKIRNRLLEVYAAMVTAETGYNSTWSLFLADIFKQPSQEEIKSAIAEFKPKHRL